MRAPVALICRCIEADKEELGAWPICVALSEAGARIAPSTYYAGRSRPAQCRVVADEILKAEVDSAGCRDSLMREVSRRGV